MLTGIFLLLLCYALGQAASDSLELPVPGSVLGMLILLAALRLRCIDEHAVAPAAGFLTRNIAFFFVPAGVGIMQYGTLLAGHWPAILIAAVPSTLLVMLCTGHILQRCRR